MPNKVKRNSEVVDMLANVSVHRGSLIKSIENLLKTIESSESAVMIPTLLRDKCEFDAWELLFVAKILKASILGHVDLVEFYMNHIGLSASQFSQQANQPNQANQQQQQQQPQTPTSNGYQHSSHPQQAQPSTPTQVILSSASPTSSTLGATAVPATSSAPISSPTASSPLSSLTTSSSCNNKNSQQPSKPDLSSWSGSLSVSSDGSSSSSSSSSSSNNENQQPASSSSLNSASYVSATSTGLPSVVETNLQQQLELVESNVESIQSDILGKNNITSVAVNQQRQAQPPSLLQLTTTNNHINSLSNIDQLGNQLNAVLQTNQTTTNSTTQVTSVANGSNGYPLAALSISTGPTTNQQPIVIGASESLQNLQQQQQQQLILQQQQKSVPELRTSRSAGCLFRLNSSGASSPRTPIQTPTTPYPQAETLAKGLQGGLHGDPSAPVKLLLQIEQLKSSIGHVTSLLESVVELYKESIDNIALA